MTLTKIYDSTPILLHFQPFSHDRIGSRKKSLSFKLIGYKNNSKAFSDIYFEVHTMSTGRQNLDVALKRVGTRVVYQRTGVRMLSHEIDFAVHSLKDLPTQLPERLVLGAVTERENQLMLWWCMRTSR